MLLKDMLDSVSIKTLREHTYKAIKSSILKNKLLPGQHISIGELAGQLGISETPVREALAILKGEGLIDYEPHRKVQIGKITEEDVRQIYEVRRLLEPHAVRLVIASISKAQELKASLERVNEQVKSFIHGPVDTSKYENYIEIDLRLNEVFLQAGGRTLFREILEFVSDRSMRIRTLVEATSRDRSTSVVNKITKEHQRIIKAMLDGNLEEAEVRLREHLINGEARTLEEIAKYNAGS
jgi:DNA-binding GntR family transcriptional regulator